MDSEAVKKWKAELIEEGILDEEFFTEFENIYKNNPDGIAKKITRLLETMESELRKVARYQRGLPGDFDKSMGALLAVRMASVSIGSKKIMTKTEEMSEFDREETDKWSDARRELKRALAELEIHMDTYLTGILDEECFTELENIYENDPDGIAKRTTGMLEMMNSDLRMLSRCQTEVPTNLDEAVSILALLEVASLSIGCKKMMTKIDEMTGIDEAEKDKWHGVRTEMKRALAELEIHMDTYLTPNSPVLPTTTVKMKKMMINAQPGPCYQLTEGLDLDGAGNGVGNHPVISSDDVNDAGRATRLPRWTMQEILVLIQGKRVADNRGRRGRSSGAGDGSVQPQSKWSTVSNYFKRRGVNREPVQCRMRWGNLAEDYKKIKEWEARIKDETESFWIMRSDLRRERSLPGCFDREVWTSSTGGRLRVRFSMPRRSWSSPLVLQR
ncbi:hypothetical protein SAY87_016164 [Trapa incisa]|uniref:Myb-like domain-containing protein n=1 Tax=Trapa incisa TaxID=236973 RepID=A0AAN7L0U4_9MYRT|nr:hypothetical protein SAY87_016164 [Trapa incisa]